MNKIIKGGFLAGHRTYILAAIGIVTALGAYLVGDVDVFGALQTIFTMGGIFFLRKSNEAKKD